jgi:hypothetical protein
MTNRFEKSKRSIGVFINITKDGKKVEDPIILSELVNKLEDQYGFRLECFPDKNGKPCIMLPMD